jgi:hypothetical protein
MAASSVEVGRACLVDVEDFPWALRQRIGEHAASALSEVLASERKETVTLVLEAFDDRFGRLREEWRAELGEQLAAFRDDLRADFKELRSEVRVEVANVRADLLKWSFLFWVSQLAAIGGLMSVFL